MVKYDRPEIKQVTKQWVSENCDHILVDRDWELLELLDKYRLLRRDQIQALLPGAFPNEDRLQRRLKRLYELHIVDRICPKLGVGEGTSKQHVCLDRAGFMLLEKEQNKYIQGKDGNKSLPSNWKHKIAIYDYEVLIRNIVESIGGEVIDRWVEDPIKHNNTSLIPDLMVVVKYKRYHILAIEVDLCTEDVKTVRGKFENYKQCRHAGTWAHKDWATMFKNPVFPKILFFTNNGRAQRVERLGKIASEEYSGLRIKVDFHENAREVIQTILKG